MKQSFFLMFIFLILSFNSYSVEVIKESSLRNISEKTYVNKKTFTKKKISRRIKFKDKVDTLLKKETNWKRIALFSLLFGLSGIVAGVILTILFSNLLFMGVASFFGLVSFILGIISLIKIKKTESKGKGLAVASIVTGIFEFVLPFLVLMLAIIALSSVNISI